MPLLPFNPADVPAGFAPAQPAPAPALLAAPVHPTRGEDEQAQPDPDGVGKYHRFKIKPVVVRSFHERGWY